MAEEITASGAITVTGTTSTTISIRLKSIPYAIGYVVVYRLASETAVLGQIDTTNLAVSLVELTPGTEYAINYYGYNEIGTGPYMPEPVFQSTNEPLTLWTWDGLNGAATAEQVKAAYAAVTTKGQTADFSRLVWNDLADKTLSALVESGLSWDSIYTTLADAKMTAAGDALTAKRFNSLVKNLRYPWMYWACKPNRNGYLGRLAVSSGDIVYGAYLLELAHILNVMTDAAGDLGAGYADLLRHSNTIAMQSLWSAKLRAPAADHLSHGNIISFSGRQSLTDPASRHLSVFKNIAVSDSDAWMIAPRATRMTISQTIAISADGSDAQMIAPRSARMAITPAEEILRSILAATMDVPSSVHMAMAAVEALATAFAFSLSAAQSAHMGLSDTVSAATHGSFALNVPVSASLLASISERFGLAQDCALDAYASVPMAVAGICVTTGEQALDAPECVCIAMVGVIHSVCDIGLTAKPVVEPTSDWVVVDGTNIKIFRTYYNRTDDADSTNLLIDKAYYEDPVETDTNLYITSEGYNDYGLEVGADENST